MLGNNHSQTRTRKGWTILVGVIVISLLLSGCGGGQQAKVYHVGMIFSRTGFEDISAGFKTKMTELGYTEGKNIVYDIQIVNAGTATAEKITQKFVADKVDLILACATTSAVTAKATTQGTNIPVIFAFTTIEGTTLVNNVREPGGNITGVRYPGPELTAKRFEILHEAVPQLKRLYITYQADYPTTKSALEALRPAATAAGVTLVEVPITKVEDIAADLDARAKAADIGMDAILIMPETLSQSAAGWGAISKFAAEHKIPIAGNAVAHAQQGALFSYAPTYSENGTQAALLAIKIFKGTPAGTIPVVSPESQLLLNYKVAQQLGLTVPQGLLGQANEIIR